MTYKGISGFLLAGLCIAAFLATGVMGAAGMSYADHPSSLNSADLYKEIQKPYGYSGPQSALDLADAYKALQKWNAYSGDEWYYWANIWLNEL